MDRTTFVKLYFNFCSEVGERPENVLVSAGGALLMLGMREETSDLDLDVRPEVYDLYKHKDNVRRNSMAEYVDYSDVISLHEMPDDIGKQEVDGVWLYSTADLIDQKTQLHQMPDRAEGKAARDWNDLQMLHALNAQTDWVATLPSEVKAC